MRDMNICDKVEQAFGQVGWLALVILVALCISLLLLGWILLLLAYPVIAVPLPFALLGGLLIAAKLRGEGET